MIVGFCFFIEKIKFEEDNSFLRLRILIKFINIIGFILVMVDFGN